MRTGWYPRITLAAAFILTAGCGGDADREAGGYRTAVPEETFAYESTHAPLDPVAPARPNVLLITLDTVRADRLGPYGYAPAHTPHLDAFAEEAVLFEHCCASVPVTLPSHATIITGLEPYEHGVRNNGIHAIAPDITTLAERLGAAGYATGAVMGSMVLGNRYGTAQGFDHFDDRFTQPIPGLPVAERRAARISELGAAWIREHRDRPWFAWLHYFDPHDPYDPPAPYDRTCARPYDGEIAYTDAHLGGLFRELRRQGLWDATTIIVTADHGEGLGEHDEDTHSLFVYHSTIHVPLLIKPPSTGAWAGRDLGGQRRTGLVATTDIYPTILDLAGLGAAAAAGSRAEDAGSEGAGDQDTGAETARFGSSGHSLRPALEGRPHARRWAYLESLVPELDYGWSPYRGIVRDGWKYIHAPRPELYDLRRDPRERRNRVAAEPERAEAMREKLMEVCATDRRATPIAMDAAAVEQLRSLGYIAGGGAGTAEDRPDAKDMKWALDAFDEVRGLMSQARIAEVIALLEDVLDRDATNRYAQRLLAHHYLLAGMGETADRLLTRMLREQPDAADSGLLRVQQAEARLIAGKPQACLSLCASLIEEAGSEGESAPAGVHLLRARALAAQGDLAGARRAVERERRLHPGSTEWAIVLADLYLRRGDVDAADQAIAQVVSQDGVRADVAATLAAVRLEQGRLREAAGLVRSVLAADPHHARALYLKGRLAARQNRPRQALQAFLRAVTAEPGNGSFHARLGRLLASGGNYPKAIEHLRKALRLAPRNQRAYLALGEAYDASGQPEAAERVWRQGLAVRDSGRVADRIEARLEALDS